MEVSGTNDGGGKQVRCRTVTCSRRAREADRAAVAFVAMLLAGGVVYFRELGTELATPLLAALGWMGIVAFWVSLGTAYAVQQNRHAAHESAWKPRDILASLAVLNCVGLYALPLLAFFAFRKGEGAVEKSDEADER